VLVNWTAIFTRIPDLRAQVLRRATAGPEPWSGWEMVGTGPDGAPVVRIDWTRFYPAPAATTAGG
jgi:hypothetical protein